MKVISYEAWQVLNKQDPSTCSECDGDGEMECDLGHMHDCRACSGSGKYESMSLRREYEEAVMTDIVALANWVALFKPRYWPEGRFGASPYSMIKDRKLEFSTVGWAPWIEFIKVPKAEDITVSTN